MANPELIKLIADPDADVRSRAADALGKVGMGQPAAVEGLLTLIADPDADVRRIAAREWLKR
jgi:HEAT repeat protein